jgi:Fe-S-cluster containining protein
MAVAPADLAAALRAKNHPEALFPIEAFENLPEAFLKLARKVGTDLAVIMLKRSDNGDCVYLKDGTCSIYERRPTICREFDCRAMFLGQSRNQRRDWVKTGMMPREVYQAARERLGR